MRSASHFYPCFFIRFLLGFKPFWSLRSKPCCCFKSIGHFGDFISGFIAFFLYQKTKLSYLNQDIRSFFRDPDSVGFFTSKRPWPRAKRQKRILTSTKKPAFAGLDWYTYGNLNSSLPD